MPTSQSDSGNRPPAAVAELTKPVVDGLLHNGLSPSEMDRRSQEHDERERRRKLATLVNALASSLGPRYSPDRCTLDRFRQYHASQGPVVTRLRGIAERMEEFIRDGGSLVFLGSVGTGKDHLLAAMLYQAALLGHSCRWVNGQEFFGALYDRMDTGQRDEDYFRELCSPEVLGISDPIPPHGDPKEWELRNLYRIIDRRYRSMKCTWVTINATADDADRQLSEPVFDRLRHGAEVLPCFWPSFRERSK